MKKIIIILLLVLGYQGFSQTATNSFYPEVVDTMVFVEDDIINVIENSKSILTMLDMFMERKDSTFYVKTMEFWPEKDSIFASVYMESSAFFSRKSPKTISCVYIIMVDKWGNELQITQEEMIHYPKLSAYLDKKIQNAKLTDMSDGGKYTPPEFFQKGLGLSIKKDFLFWEVFSIS